MTKFGYARVSTSGQTVDTQIQQLVKNGVESKNIFQETISGAKAAKDRPALKELLSILREGDELHITKLDRLGRNLRELENIASELERRGVSLTFGGTTYNPKDPFSRVFFQLIGVFAEFERELIAARTKERLDAIRAEGGRVGRKRKTTPEQEALIYKLHEEGLTNAELRKLAGVSNGTLYRIFREGDAALAEASDGQIKRTRLELEAKAEKDRTSRLKKAQGRYDALQKVGVES